MKKIIIIFLIVILSNCTKKENAETIDANQQMDMSETQVTNKIMYVDSPEGLRVRNAPGTSGERIALLDDKMEVLLIQEDENEVNIDGIKGKWVLIKYNDIEGWVFSGFLSLTEPLRGILDNRQDIFNTINNTTWSVYNVNSEDIIKPHWNRDDFYPGIGFYFQAFRFYSDNRCIVYDPDIPLIEAASGTWRINGNKLEIKVDYDNYNGEYTLELTEEWHLTLYQGNGNIYKCTRDDIFNKDTDNMTAFLANGGDKELRSDWYNTLLSYCLNHGDIRNAEILLNAGANVNAKNIYGQTALFYASYMGFSEVIAKLLSLGADVNEKDKWGQTPLDMTVRENLFPYSGVNWQATKRILLENGAVYGVYNKQ
jgi:hypothetical protein